MNDGRGDWYGFPAHPRASYLGGQRVYAAPGGSVREIHWHAWTMDVTPEEAIAWFAERLGPGDRSSDGPPTATWRDDPQTPRRVLTVFAADAPGPYTALGALPAGARCVAMASNAIRA